jgi:hypothetical protein
VCRYGVDWPRAAFKASAAPELQTANGMTTRRSAQRGFLLFLYCLPFSFLKKNIFLVFLI